MSTQGFFDSLEQQLGDRLERTTARRATRRRVVQRAGGVGVGALALVIAALVVTGDEPAAAGVDVETRDGLVYVRLTDVEHRADVIEDAAAAAGLDVTVEEVPVGPSLVGRFITEEREGVIGELRELDRDGPSFSGFVLPANYDGTLVLRVGRPADGEPYIQFSNALSEGEPLACSGLLGADPAHAREIVDAHDVDATWVVVTDGGGQRPVAADELEALDDVEVGQAVAVSADAVFISLVAPGTTLDTALTAPAAC